MKIIWEKVENYNETKGKSKCIYIYSWKDEYYSLEYYPYYIGKVDDSTFSGSSKSRYNSAYAHLIEGCLEHGGTLHFGIPDKKNKISSVEETMILLFLPDKNKNVNIKDIDFRLENEGDLPVFLNNLTIPQIINKIISNFLIYCSDKLKALDKNSIIDFKRINALIENANNDQLYFGIDRVEEIFLRILCDVEKLPKSKVNKIIIEFNVIYKALQNIV